MGLGGGRGRDDVNTAIALKGNTSRSVNRSKNLQEIQRFHRSGQTRAASLISVSIHTQASELL